MVAAAKADFDSNVTQHITDEVNGTFKRPYGPGGPGGGPQRGFGFRGGFGLDAAAKAIGVSTDTLEQDLKNGQTIAAVAKSKDVAVKTVVDAMVASAKAEFDVAGEGRAPHGRSGREDRGQPHVDDHQPGERHASAPGRYARRLRRPGRLRRSRRLRRSAGWRSDARQRAERRRSAGLNA